jgi:hypothetical protein
MRSISIFHGRATDAAVVDELQRFRNRGYVRFLDAMDLREDAFPDEPRLVRQVASNETSRSETERLGLLLLFHLLGSIRVARDVQDLLHIDLEGPQVNALAVQEEEHALHVRFSGAVVPRVGQDLLQHTMVIGDENPGSCHCLAA